jgi:hypothetical protein
MAMPITSYAKSGVVHIKGLQESMDIYAALNWRPPMGQSN